MANGYLTQEVQLTQSKFLFFPEGYAGVFATIYAMIFPYIAGMFFMGVLIHNFSGDFFNTLKNAENSFIVLWLVGYELLSGLFILFVIYKVITYSEENISGRYNRKNTNLSNRNRKKSKNRFPHSR